MTPETFNEVVKFWHDKEKETLTVKSAEYSTGADKLQNFKEAAAMLGCTPKEALWGFVSKHIIATQSFIKRDAQRISAPRSSMGFTVGGSFVPYSQWEEKIGDIRAYLLLLDGLVRETNADAPHMALLHNGFVPRNIAIGRAENKMDVDKPNVEVSRERMTTTPEEVADAVEQMQQDQCASDHDDDNVEGRV